MNFEKTPIKDLLILKPNVFGDDRGYFLETFNQKKFNEIIGKEISFVQDNESLSKKGVLRGLHFQNPPFAQGKLVRVVKGAVLDIAVDLRKSSPTYGQHFTIELTEENKFQFWIPEGFAHGFITLRPNTIFCYKCTNFYAPKSEQTILWSDEELNIDWKIKPEFISEKDQKGIRFKDFDSLFN